MAFFDPSFSQVGFSSFRLFSKADKSSGELFTELCSDFLILFCIYNRRVYETVLDVCLSSLKT